MPESTTLPPRIISADDHMDLHVLPFDLFESRLPKDLREVGPRVVETERGTYWFCEGERWGRARPRRIRGLPSIFDRVGEEDWIERPSTSALRIEDMERDGVYASVIYPGPGGFPIKDALLKDACLRAYNDWSAEFNAYNPARLLNLALVPAHDGEAARAEIERAAAAGHRGAVIDHFTMDPPMYDPIWEPMWQAAEDAEMSISVHLGGGAYMLPRKVGSWIMTARSSVIGMQLDEVVSVVCLSGILERHPKLNIILGESGLGWIPYVLEQMDKKYRDYAANTRDYRGAITPSELFRRQVYATFEDEDFGVEMIPLIGAGSVMWASDYPHPVSTWPNSMDFISKKLGKLTDAERRMILWDNAAAIYRID